MNTSARFFSARGGVSSYAPQRAAPSEDCAYANAGTLNGLFRAWNDALASGDPERVAALYTRDAVLLPTFSGRVLQGREAIAGYFRSFLKQRPQALIGQHVAHVGCNMASDVGIYTFSVMDDTGLSREVAARYTFLYRFQDGHWRILHHHSALLPTPHLPLAVGRTQDF